jgi:hypothetical protein
MRWCNFTELSAVGGSHKKRVQDVQIVQAVQNVEQVQRVGSQQLRGWKSEAANSAVIVIRRLQRLSVGAYGKTLCAAQRQGPHSPDIIHEVKSS